MAWQLIERPLVAAAYALNLAVRARRGLHGRRRHGGAAEDIIRSCIDDCWDGTHYRASPGYFRQFWTRDLSFSAPALARLDPAYRDRVVRSFAWAIGTWQRRGSHVTTTIHYFDQPVDVFEPAQAGVEIDRYRAWIERDDTFWEVIDDETGRRYSSTFLTRSDEHALVGDLPGRAHKPQSTSGHHAGTCTGGYRARVSSEPMTTWQAYHLGMGTKGRDVLAGRTRVLVDGSNQRGPGFEPVADEPYARSLRALFPPSIEIVVVFDTDPPIGSATLRNVGGVTIVHARAGGGDDAIVRRTAAAPNQTLVVTNDIDLRDRVSLLGARAERNDWLRDRIERGRQRSPSVGRKLKRMPGVAPHEEADDADRSWQPGRGATVKRGPSKKPPRRH